MTSLASRPRKALAAGVAAVLTAALSTGGAFSAPAHAASPGTLANTSVDNTYLQDTLGLPLTTVIETVTYDRFQWLLQQSGQFAFIIGNVNDAGFAERAREVDAAARAAGASKVYWYDPNLSGLSGAHNLDTRNPEGIDLHADSQAIYGRTWQNVLGQYLGNGIKSTPSANQQSVTVSADDSIVNDAVDPVWDYRSTETAAVTTTDDIFFVYDKDNVAEGGGADKIVAWANLSELDNATDAVTAALATVGGAEIDQLSQFSWWKSAANSKHARSYPNVDRYGGDIIDDADSAEGWRVEQLTYPELLHLLDKQQADANFVLLFGGTWCHNTRAVLKQVNANAQDYGVQKVYNFDFVLDGGNVNGSNGGTNPLHIRDNHSRTAGGVTYAKFRPSYLYGDVFARYFQNVITEYSPNQNGVAYFPGGDTGGTQQLARKAQVPFVIHYERGTGADPQAESVQRQWIQRNVNPNTQAVTYKEYMTEWWFTEPSPWIGLSFDPVNTSPLTSQQQGQLNTANNNLAFGQEAVQKLVEFFGGLPSKPIPAATVSADSIAYGETATISATIPTTGGNAPTAQVTLQIAGESFTSPLAGNTASFNVNGLGGGEHAFTVSYPGDANLAPVTVTGTQTVTRIAVGGVSGAVGNETTTTSGGTYNVSVTTPDGLAAATGNVTLTLTKGANSQEAVGTVTGGSATVSLPALAAGTWTVDVAYGGDGNYAPASHSGESVVVARPAGEHLVDAPNVPYGSDVTVTFTVGIPDVEEGAEEIVPAGTVSLDFAGTTYEGTLNGDTATWTISGLGVGSYNYTVSYNGDENIADASISDSVSVTKLAVNGLTGSATTAPTTVAEGAFAAAVASESGKPTPTGSVTVSLTKGATVVNVAGDLVDGATTLTLPVLGEGSWTVNLTYSGDGIYFGTTTPAGSIDVHAPAPPAQEEEPPANNPPANNPPANNGNNGNNNGNKSNTTTTTTKTTTATTDATTTEVEAEDNEADEPVDESADEPTGEPESAGAAPEETDEVLSAADTASSSEIPTNILALGALTGVGLIGYVAFQIISGARTRP